MCSRGKYRAGSDGGTVSIIFVAILAYRLLANHALMNRVETAVKYTLMVIALITLAMLIIRLAKKFKKIKYHHGSKTVDIMTGVEFEHYVAKLLVKQGYKNISLTERYDYGVDIIAEKDGIRWGIQVKRHTGLVKAIAVRQVVTALRKYGCDRAMVVSNSRFSRVAIELARTNDCTLVGRSTLISWIKVG